MILFVCHGNINRSAAAEALLRHRGHTRVSSAGFVNPGRRMAKKMREAMIEQGCDPQSIEAHRSQLVTEQLCQKANLILYMDSGNLRRLMEAVPQHRNKFKCLGDFCWPPRLRIPDPAFMRKGSEEFRHVVKWLVEATKNIQLGNT